MQESIPDQSDDWLTAGEIAAIADALPEEIEEIEEPDEEDAIRERLRQIRHNTAHIPVAEDKDGMFERLTRLFRKGV